MGLDKFAAVMAFTGNVHAPLARPLGGSDRLEKLGAVASLDSVFECPPLVKHVLAAEVPLTSTFLVRRDEDVDAIFNNSNVMQIYSPNRCHRKTVSRCAPPGNCPTRT